MKSTIGYILIGLFSAAIVWMLVDSLSHVVTVQSSIDSTYASLIAKTEKEIAGPAGTPTDAARQAFITYLSPTTVVKPGQAVLIVPHIANGKPDPIYLFDVSVGDILLGTYDRQQIEGYFYGRGQGKSLDANGL